jgi:hypothetical protein
VEHIREQVREDEIVIHEDNPGSHGGRPPSWRAPGLAAGRPRTSSVIVVSRALVV